MFSQNNVSTFKKLTSTLSGGLCKTVVSLFSSISFFSFLIEFKTLENNSSRLKKLCPWMQFSNLI